MADSLPNALPPPLTLRKVRQAERRAWLASDGTGYYYDGESGRVWSTGYLLTALLAVLLMLVVFPMGLWSLGIAFGHYPGRRRWRRR